MKKVICDVCGTAYPDNAEHCPICGCSKPVDADAAAVAGEADATYTCVKGGRFSKSNVRKRNKATGLARQPDPDEDESYYEEPDQRSNKGLMIAVVFLALAILAVIAYIVFFIFGDGGAQPQAQPGIQTAPSQSQSTTVTTAPAVPETTEPDLSCTGLELENEKLTIIAAGESVLISVSCQPENTTDALSFTSSDPAIATVTDDGCVTAVAPGEVTVTVTCGSASATCTVVCDFEEEPTAPELSGNYAMFIDNSNVENRRWGNEVTMSRSQTFRLCVKDLDTKEEIDVEWVVEKANIITITGTTVKAVGTGTTKVTCTIGDETFTCIVRVTG